MGWVYVIKNLKTRSLYVGITTKKKAAVRWRQHLQKLRQGTHPNPRLQGAWKAFGPSAFVFQPLFERPSQRLLLQSEAGLIKYLRSNGVGLYNYGDGGGYGPAIRRANRKRRFDPSRLRKRLERRRNRRGMRKT